jgi:hypothetical protein
VSDFEDKLLKTKEEKFIQYVELASKMYDLLSIPQVVFEDGLLPYNPRWLACIDLNNMVIYVSRVHLKEMPFEQIKETAFHEVTHVVNPPHDTDFHNTLDDVLVATWEPYSTSGIIMIDGGKREIIEGKKFEPNLISKYKRTIKIINISNKPEKNCIIKLMDSYIEYSSSKIYQGLTDENGTAIFNGIPEGIYMQRIYSGNDYIEEIVELTKDDDIVIKIKTADKIESTIILKNFIDLPFKNCRIEITRIDDDFYDNPIKFNEVTNNQGEANFKDIFNGNYLVCFLGTRQIIELTNQGFFIIKIPFIQKEDKKLDEKINKVKNESRIFKVIPEEKFYEKFRIRSKFDCCEYHLCRQNKELHQCPYCKNWYCDNHYRPTKPYSLNFNDAKEFEKWKEYTIPPFHPCPIYFDYKHKIER